MDELGADCEQKSLNNMIFLFNLINITLSLKVLLELSLTKNIFCLFDI